MPHQEPKVLMAVNDPGAANFWAPVARELRGKAPLTVALGEPAQKAFQRCGVAFEKADSKTVTEWMESEQPDVVAVGTSENEEVLDRQLVLAGRTLAIPVVSAVDYWSQYRNRFVRQSSGEMDFVPDWICAADEKMQSGLTKAGIDAGRIVVTGHPHLENLKSQWGQTGITRIAVFEKLGFDPEFPLVCFVSETFGWEAQEDYRFASESGHSERTLVMLENFLQVTGDIAEQTGKCIQVVNKLHPKNRLQEFEFFESPYPVTSVHDMDPYALIQAADIVVGMTSMLLLEAAALGKQVLSLVPRLEEEEIIPNAGGNWSIARNAQELNDQLLSLIIDEKAQLHSPFDFSRPHEGATDRVIRQLMKQEKVVSC